MVDPFSFLDRLRHALLLWHQPHRDGLADWGEVCRFGQLYAHVGRMSFSGRHLA